LASAKTITAVVLLALALLGASPSRAGKPLEVVFYWTIKKAHTELAQDGVKARCRGRYQRFRAAGEWYYHYFRCSGPKAGRFDLVVRGEHRYERRPSVDPDPAP
jgi:hypothetical protein